mmetsp:Transcript_11087/g.11181  ORF Transcript_11087/g.11181 Transcript_11087/m.11181 type:complete len:97 (+) Transcript_11087:746-1036(+)
MRNFNEANISTSDNDKSSFELGFKLGIKDKIKLCEGALANLSIKEKLKYLKIPIIYIYSKKNCFIHLKHSDVIKRSLNWGQEASSIQSNYYTPSYQ